MRDFLIAEIIIANAQRPGVICGMTVDEVNAGLDNLTHQGYHQLMISSHKTGYLQSATLFIYSEIYVALSIFTHNVLTRLSHISTRCFTDSKVFRLYSGIQLPSSKISCVLRNALNRQGINFNGTITDFRKAAATLTGKLNPNLHELMSLFMCHTRRVHDQFYRDNLGHPGLVQAFEALESMQKDVDVEFDIPTSNIQNTRYSH